MEHLKKYWIYYLIGIIFLILLYRWWKCKQSGKACPTCAAADRIVNCSFWTGKEISETGPKEGDTKVENGITYIYKCQEVQCIMAPCPPMCSWVEEVTPPVSTTNLKIINKKGAEIYQQEADGTMKGTGSTVSKDTVLAYTNKVNAGYCPKNSQVCLLPKDLYQTSSGWLLETDITTI